jgi:hypothetical protein
MTAIYEHNLGFWEIDCPEEHAFFEHVQNQTSGSCRPKLSALLYLRARMPRTHGDERIWPRRAENRLRPMNAVPNLSAQNGSDRQIAKL